MASSASSTTKTTTAKPVTAITTAATAATAAARNAFAHSKDGKPYRSFRLVSVNHTDWTAEGVQHTALNKSKTVTQNTTHLGPLRAAQKIFDSWCRHNQLVIIAPTAFVIQETTRGKQGKVYSYTGFREKLDQPRLVTVTNKATNTTHTVKYAYRSKVKALRKLAEAAATTAKKGAKATTKAVKGVKGVKGKATNKSVEVATAAGTTGEAAATNTVANKAVAKKAAPKKVVAKKVVAKKAAPKKAVSKVGKATKAKGGNGKKTTVSLS